MSTWKHFDTIQQTFSFHLFPALLLQLHGTVTRKLSRGRIQRHCCKLVIFVHVIDRFCDTIFPVCNASLEGYLSCRLKDLDLDSRKAINDAVCITSVSNLSRAPRFLFGLSVAWLVRWIGLTKPGAVLCPLTCTVRISLVLRLKPQQCIEDKDLRHAACPFRIFLEWCNEFDKKRHISCNRC